MLKLSTDECVHMWVSVFLFRLSAIIAGVFCLSTWVDSFSARCQRNSWRQTLSLYVYFFIIQICSNTENISRISCYSNHFLYTHKAWTILQHSQSMSSQLQNPKLYFSWLFSNQPALWENYKNLIFHINPIHTAVKNITNMIFSKARYFCYIPIC